MAGPSRLVATALLRNCRSWTTSESFLRGNVFPPLGETGGCIGNQGLRVGSIRRTTFDTSSAGQHAVMGLEDSHTTRPSPGIRFQVETSGAILPPTAQGSSGFSETGNSQSSSPASGVQAIIESAGDGALPLAEKVIARLSNVPKFVFKSDLLWLLKGCNLIPDDFLFVYDSKYRLKFIQIQLPSPESYHLVRKALASKGRLGGRYLKLTSEVFEMDEFNKVIQPFRGRSLLMVKVPFGVTTEDVERFFSGYALDSSYSVKFLRSQFQAAVAGNRGSTLQPKPEFEIRACVRFRTELEALRALREKQGSFCLDKPTDLRFIS